MTVTKCVGSPLYRLSAAVTSHVWLCVDIRSSASGKLGAGVARLLTS